MCSDSGLTYAPVAKEEEDEEEEEEEEEERPNWETQPPTFSSLTIQDKQMIQREGDERGDAIDTDTQIHFFVYSNREDIGGGGRAHKRDEGRRGEVQTSMQSVWLAASPVCSVHEALSLALAWLERD